MLRSGMVAQGPEVAAFEQRVRRALRRRAAPSVAVNSGTSGLHLGLLAAGVGPGDEVIVPSFTFAATANSVALTGATPVFADIEPEHVHASTPPPSRPRSPTRTKGDHAGAPLRPPGAHGASSARSPSEHGIALFEDAAQAHGASLRRPPGRHVRRASRCSRLYPTKNMTSGEGGMVTPPTRRARARACGCCATRAWSSSTRTRSSGSTPA